MPLSLASGTSEPVVRGGREFEGIDDMLQGSPRSSTSMPEFYRLSACHQPDSMARHPPRGGERACDGGAETAIGAQRALIALIGNPLHVKGFGCRPEEAMGRSCKRQQSAQTDGRAPDLRGS
jgi:hypothetical protein